MKAISLWQPWATLVAIGAKRIETRSWSTNYRGPVAIQAAKRWTQELRELCLTEPFVSVLAMERPNRGGAFYLDDCLDEILPRGVVVATAMLSDCWRVERIKKAHANTTPESNARIADTLPFAGQSEEAIADALRPMLSDQELAFGDFSEGRYGWFLTDITKLPTPIPYRGAQGLFNIPDDVIAGRGMRRG